MELIYLILASINLAFSAVFAVGEDWERANWHATLAVITLIPLLLP